MANEMQSMGNYRYVVVIMWQSCWCPRDAVRFALQHTYLPAVEVRHDSCLWMYTRGLRDGAYSFYPPIPQPHPPLPARAVACRMVFPQKGYRSKYMPLLAKYSGPSDRTGTIDQATLDIYDIFTEYFSYDFQVWAIRGVGDAELPFVTVRQSLLTMHCCCITWPLLGSWQDHDNHGWRAPCMYTDAHCTAAGCGAVSQEEEQQVASHLTSKKRALHPRTSWR